MVMLSMDSGGPAASLLLVGEDGLRIWGEAFSEPSKTGGLRGETGREATGCCHGVPSGSLVRTRQTPEPNTESKINWIAPECRV